MRIIIDPKDLPNEGKDFRFALRDTWEILKVNPKMTNTFISKNIMERFKLLFGMELPTLQPSR